MTEEFEEEEEGFLRWFGKFITSTPILSLLVIIFFLPFIVSVGNVFFPESLPKHISKILPDHIIALLNVKNTGSVFGVIFGFLLFAQRLDVMNKQAETAQDHIESTQDQHEVDLFKQACELLGNKEMVTRLGGITLLGALARTRPEEWHITIIDTLALFIRERSMNDDNSPVKALKEWYETKGEDLKEEKWQKFDEIKARKAPNDIEAAVRVITCNLTENQQSISSKKTKDGNLWPDLRYCWLNRVNFQDAWLPSAYLEGTHLIWAKFDYAFLSDANFNYANLHCATFIDTFLSKTDFSYANLTKVYFEKAEILAKNQLSESFYFESCDLIPAPSDDTKPINLPAGIKPPKKEQKKNYYEILGYTQNIHEHGRVIPMSLKRGPDE